METTYLICAAVGGTLIFCQFVMTLLGLGHGDAEVGGHDVGGHDVGGHDVGEHDVGEHDGHEAGHEHGATWFFSWLTFRTLSAALAFFGLTGLLALQWQIEPLPAFGIALAAGAAAIVLVGWLMRLLHRFNIDGTARIERSVGSRGTVYLSIPPGGVGKVHLSLQHRTIECKAVAGEESALATGTKVVVVAVIGPDTVKVAPAAETERNSHV